MLLSDRLSKGSILPDLKSRDKKGAIREAVALLSADIPELDTEAAAKALMERELLGSTGIGDGVAIPHAKYSGLMDIKVVMAISREGVDFDSLDGAPVHWLFVVLAPEGSAGMHLKLLARISRLVRADGFCENLLKLEQPEDILEHIKEIEENF